jgi:hypothetical protein
MAMNKLEKDFLPGAAAELEYLDGDYRVIKPGEYVVCAVTGSLIPLDALRYWCVDLQEAYVTAGVALRRMREAGLTP